jgi:cyanophycin synthetase
MNNARESFETSIASLPARGAQLHEAPASNPIDPVPPVRWRGTATLRGCNLYHERTVQWVDLDLGVLDDKTSGCCGPKFADRFIARFHDPAQTPPTARLDPAFLEALRSTDGAPFEQVLLEAILAVERRLAFARRDFVPIAMARVESIASPERSRQVRLIWESTHSKQSRAAARLALSGVLDLVPHSLGAVVEGESPDFDAALAALCQRASRYQTSTTTSVIALAAHVRGIPWESISGPHLLLGHGSVQRIVYSSVPPGATLAATQLSRNKQKTTRRLAQLGLPVTRQILVASTDEALAAAEKLGMPVVMKPRKGKQAGGVTVGIVHAEEIAGAFERAREAGSGVLVEDFVQGNTYRLLVIGGRFVAALEISVPTVVGDGSKRIDALIEMLNRDPKRNGVHLFPVEVDDDLRDCLARNGRTLSDVLPAGVEVPLRTAANVACGGIHRDVTDRVHASHRELAERAAAALDLSVTGIDVVSIDIGQPCDEAHTRILEVNARPGLCMHTFPRHGHGRDVAGAMLEQMFPAGAAGRIPTALVIGQRGAGAVARELDAMLRGSGKTTGLITRSATVLAGQPLPADQQRPHEALTVMRRDPRLQALVAATSPRRAVAVGLTLGHADAVALLAATAQDDVEVYRHAVALAARVTRGPIVVAADNITALRLLREMQGTGAVEPEQVILVGRQVHEAATDETVPEKAKAEPVAAAASSASGPRTRLFAVLLGKAMGLSDKGGRSVATSASLRGIPER